MRVFIRVDSSLEIGMGHLMRSLTLADALKNRHGAEVELICRTHPGHLIDFVEKEKGYPVHRIAPDSDFLAQTQKEEIYRRWLGGSWEDDAEATAEFLKIEKPDWLVVDHYGIDQRWEHRLRSNVSNIMVIDDLADRPHNCDILLDQNFLLEEGRYDERVDSSCRKLLGPQYALLRDEFIQQRRQLRQRGGTIDRIMVFYGGSDRDNLTGLTLEAVRRLGDSRPKVDVVMGASNPHQKQIYRQAEEMGHVECHTQVNNIAVLMAQADLAIGAGGTANWERCCLGLPCMVVTVAENQEQIAADLAEEGYILLMGDHRQVTIDLLEQTLSDLIADPAKVSRISDRALSLLEGNGTNLVAEQMLQITRSTDS